MVVTRTHGVLLFAVWLVHCGNSHAPHSGGPASGAGGGEAAGTGGVKPNAGSSGEGGVKPSAGSSGSSGSGGSSGSSGSSGSGGEKPSAGSSGSGGSMNGGTSSGAPSTGGSGGLPNAGRADGGGAPAAGEGGAPSEPLGDGFSCEHEVCVPGEVCVNCDFFGDAIPLICAPDPALDQAGYDARVEQEGCLAVHAAWECDGPEDCAPGERCAASTELPYPMGTCVSEPPCEAPYVCVICRADDDCPGTSACTDERHVLYRSQLFCAE